MKLFLNIFLITSALFSCQSKNENQISTNETAKTSVKNDLKFDTSIQTAHVFVALCDNKYQGIVPVPAGIGNGQDPTNNLYWGAGYGVKSFFKKSKDWKLLKAYKLNDTILERLIFKHKTKNFYLIADAYDGKEIQKTTEDFLYSSSGQQKDTLNIDNKTIGINGNANLVAYIGHDGLMDFKLKDDFKNEDQKKRDAIILACYSKHYFGPLLEDANINPLVWTSNLMAPEAYILHDALSGYLAKESNTEIQNRAATAYSKYQKISLKSAKKLLVTDW